MNGFSAERCLVFSGEINPATANSLMCALCGMVNEGATKVDVLFSSTGGSVDAGVMLYTYISALPAKVVMRASGIVASMAIPIFLASDERYASENSRFMFHEYSWTHGMPNITTQTTMHEHALRLINVLDWTKEIVKQKTRMTDDFFEEKKLFDFPYLMSPNEAVEFGLVSSIAEPKITVNSQPRIAV